MSRGVCKYIVLLIVALAVSVASYGQKFPERRHIREGNGLYEKQRFADAEKSYRRALQKDSLSVEGAFNLGDTHYATENFAAAEEQFRKVAERKEGVSDTQRAAAYFNLGNSQFQQQKLDEALESYKQSLKYNPSDLEAKFNYAYTKAMKDQQDKNQQNQNNQNNQNNNQDQQQQDKNDQQQNDQNQQNNQNQQQPDGQQGQNDQQQQPEEPQGDKPKPSDQGEQQQQPQAGPSKENEQLLNAVQAAEDKTRDKVDAERVVGVARSGKNW